jgi:beta-galactosidase
MDRLEESLRRTIRNHRNHPSVWGWGAGINHRGPVKRLHYAAKQEDPDRITMNNGTVWTGPQNRGITDLYAVMDYQDVTRPEGAFLFAMEHSGSDEHSDATDTIGLQEIVSKYKADPWLIGLTAWSAHDSNSFKKRGEENPNLSEWTAASWDAFRIRKPLFYWYQSEMTTEPMVHIPDERAQHEGTVTVLSNCEEIELFVNGESVGIRSPEQRDSTRHINSPSFLFPVDWRSGDLAAEGRIDGKVVATHVRLRPGPAHHIELSFDPDAGPFLADGSSIYLATARICDAEGTTIEEPTPEVTFELEGPGRIVGDASIGANPVSWKAGIAPVLVRAGTEPDKLVLTARAEGLEAGSAILETLPWNPDLNAKQRPVRELLRLRVDLGGPGQHVEDEWTGWSLDGAVSDPEVFDADGRQVRATISARKGDLDATSTWGVPGDLSFLIEDGVQVTAEEGIDLQLRELPPGGYLLKTWHHVLGGREDASPLRLTADDADGDGRVLHEVFHPTFGRQIEVSSAGTGGAGDGGSNRGAAGFAESLLRVNETGTCTVRIRATGSKGVIVLNGFDLRAVPPASN